MKLFLVIAIVAVLAIVILSMKRGGTRITRIDRERKRDDEDANG